MKKFLPMMLTCLIAGIVLAILAPYGTDQFKPIFRFTYWVGLCLAGGLGAAATDLALQAFRKQVPTWLHVALQSLTASLAVSAVMVLLPYSMSGHLPSVQNFAQLFFYIWVISITISSIGALIARRKEAGAAAPERAALYERLPPKLRSADIYALSAEDHYVRVITSSGEDLILMRLSDAIKETAPLKGLSPHRSWWVAEAGAQTINKSEITLPSGQTVPISRSGMKLVKEAGWV